MPYRNRTKITGIPSATPTPAAKGIDRAQAMASYNKAKTRQSYGMRTPGQSVTQPPWATVMRPGQPVSRSPWSTNLNPGQPVVRPPHNAMLRPGQPVVRPPHNTILRPGQPVNPWGQWR